MKYWLLNLLCAFVLIFSGIEIYKETLKSEILWGRVSFLSLMLIVGLYFYFVTRKKRNDYFKERMNKK